MSSLRNAVKRITHKERAQPRARAHLGLLEKKQDYKKRAVDYQQKRERLQAMKLRADMRNPDEFYMGMHNSQMKDGKHTNKTSDNIISPEVVKLMKNQDLAHVRYQQQKETKKIERLQSTLHFIDTHNSADRKHTIFVDDQRKAELFDVAQHFQTLPQLADRAFNRPRVSTLMPEDMAEDDDEGEQNAKKANKQRIQKVVEKHKLMKIAKARDASYAELQGRITRQKAIAHAESHLCVEKLVAGKGRKRKVKEAEDGKPAVYKWRRRRAS